MPGIFEIKGTKDGQFMSNLKAGNGEVVLTSERYTKKDGANNGIASVRKNAPLGGRFETRSAKSGQPYFVLKAGNNQIIGKSEMYPSASSMKKGMASMKRNAPMPK